MQKLSKFRLNETYNCYMLANIRKIEIIRNNSTSTDRCTRNIEQYILGFHYSICHPFIDLFRNEGHIIKMQTIIPNIL